MSVGPIAAGPVRASQESARIRRKLAIFSKSPIGSNEALIISGIANSLSQNHTLIFCSTASHNLAGASFKIDNLVKRFIAIWQCDAVILHSSLAFHFLEALWCRICRKQLISLIWDRYPVTINGERFNRSLRRRIFDIIENWVVRLSTKRFVPTSDFEGDDRLQPAVTIPFWYRKHPISGHLQNLEVRTGQLEHSNSALQPVKIVFAGQINETRALDSCLKHLDQIIDTSAIVYIASKNPFSYGNFQNLKVEHLGYLSPVELSNLVIKCDYGLVSLNPLFDGPALPSKSFDYLAAGKPILYFGKTLPFYCGLLNEFSVGIDFTNLQDLSLNAGLKEQSDFNDRLDAFQSAFELDSARLCDEIDKIVE